MSQLENCQHQLSFCVDFYNRCRFLVTVSREAKSTDHFAAPNIADISLVRRVRGSGIPADCQNGMPCYSNIGEALSNDLWRQRNGGINPTHQ